MLLSRRALWAQHRHCGGVSGVSVRRAISSSPSSRPLLRTVVALSGGVDSSVAAALLVRYGPALGVEVVGAAHMTNWSAESEIESDARAPAPPLGCGVDRDLAAAVAKQLQLPFHHCEFEADFNTLVFQPLVEAFRLGGSANPDCECNRVIKFDRFARHAKRVFGNADCIATGHYARNRRWRTSAALAACVVDATGSATPPPPDGVALSNDGAEVEAWSGVARPLAAAANDQSYFLSRVRAADLDSVLFPLSELPKAEIRRLARDVFGLPTADRPTSTGVCFIGKRDFGTFIAAHAASTTEASSSSTSNDGEDTSSSSSGLYAPGPMRWAASGRPVDGTRFDHGKPKPKKKLPPSSSSKLAAQHRGVARYTVGQRVLVDDCLPEDGELGSSSSSNFSNGKRSLRKLFVARKEAASNTIFVVDRWDHPSLVAATGSTVELGDVMIHDAAALAQKDAVAKLELVARHGQPPVPVRLVDSGGGGGGGGGHLDRLTVELEAPIRAVCPGQVGALYATTLSASSPELSRCVAAGIILSGQS